MYTTYDSDAAAAVAAMHARGRYQQDLLRGTEAWSGATLRGKAATYSARYAESRRGLLARLRTDPRIAVLERVGRHGRREVHIAWVSDRLAALMELAQRDRSALPVLQDELLEAHGPEAVRAFPRFFPEERWRRDPDPCRTDAAITYGAAWVNDPRGLGVTLYERSGRTIGHFHSPEEALCAGRRFERRTGRPFLIYPHPTRRAARDHQSYDGRRSP